MYLPKIGTHFHLVSKTLLDKIHSKIIDYFNSNDITGNIDFDDI